MIKPEELYSKTKLPVDEKLLDNLINKYLQISFSEMNNPSIELKNSLYYKININKDDVTDFNQNDLNNLLSIINSDFIKAGKPFDPSLHNGLTNPIGVMPGWLTFKSWNLLGTRKLSDKEILHRFYFGISNDKLYDLATILYEKFKAKGIPFYFKTENNKYIERQDNLVLYTTTDLLDKTLEIFEEIGKERPDLISNCKNPSILMGNIGNKIGYASENPNAKTSYTDLICEAFLNAIIITLNEYMCVNYDPKIREQFNQKIQQYNCNGREIKTKKVKYRILFFILLNNVPIFKQKLLNVFKKELISKKIDINNICFNDIAKREIEKHFSNNIILFNETAMSCDEYIKRNKVLYYIPLTAEIILKDGSHMSGELFLKYFLKKASNFRTFQDFFMHYIAKVNKKGINDNPSNTFITNEEEMKGIKK